MEEFLKEFVKTYTHFANVSKDELFRKIQSLDTEDPLYTWQQGNLKSSMGFRNGQLDILERLEKEL